MVPHNLLLAGAVYAQLDIPIMCVLQDSISPTAMRGLGAYTSKARQRQESLLQSEICAAVTELRLNLGLILHVELRRCGFKG